MRILIAHNRYHFSGGEDAVVRDEVDLLSRFGHAVRLIEEDNDSIQGIVGKLTASASVVYSPRSRQRMRAEIQDFQPDVVHVHNWFPRLSPSILMEASARKIPVVQTVHNFRMLCANALLFREGRICTECVGKALPLGGVLHGCYRGSRAGSAVVTAAFALHRFAHTWNHVDVFIAVSDFEREILVRGGVPVGKIIVKPNFVYPPVPDGAAQKEDYALFVGRLSPEKGITTLLAAWNSGRIPLHLKIIGHGPLTETVRSAAAANCLIEYLGSQPPEMVHRAMARARFLVFSSECYETFGRTIVEAFSQGTPALAVDIGTARELVQDGVTGYRFAAGDPGALVSAALRFLSSPEAPQMSARCRAVYEGEFTADKNYHRLMDVYSRAREARNLRISPQTA